MKKDDKEKNVHENHRGRLRERFVKSPESLSKHELLELALFSALPRVNVNPVAHRIINKFGTLGAALHAPVSELEAIDGVGPAAAAFLNALAGGAGIGGGDYPSLADVPFTSFMDVNLAMAQAGNSLGGLASPYVNLIRNNNTSTFLSGNEEAARRSLFIAGGWNSDSNLTYEAYKAGYPGRINLR